jgi:hypothetical protein
MVASAHELQLRERAHIRTLSVPDPHRAAPQGARDADDGDVLLLVPSIVRAHHGRDCRTALGLVKPRRAAPPPSGLRA